jgi:hypothetical protein
MRDLSKVLTGSLVAGAALLVAACGGGSTANNTATDTNGLGTTEYNALPVDNTLPTDVNVVDAGVAGNVADTGVSGNVTDTANSSNAM